MVGWTSRRSVVREREDGSSTLEVLGVMIMEVVTSRSALLVLALSMGVLSACSSTPAPTASSPPEAASPTAPQEADTDGGCTVADVSGTTKNAEMMAVATTVYESLDCGATEPLEAQLKQPGREPPLVKRAQAAGATLVVDSAAGGTVMKLVAGTSGCTVTVLDGTTAKMLSCADL